MAPPQNPAFGGTADARGVVRVVTVAEYFILPPSSEECTGFSRTKSCNFHIDILIISPCYYFDSAKDRHLKCRSSLTRRGETIVAFHQTPRLRSTAFNRVSRIEMWKPRTAMFPVVNLAAPIGSGAISTSKGCRFPALDRIQLIDKKGCKCESTIIF